MPKLNPTAPRVLNLNAGPVAEGTIEVTIAGTDTPVTLYSDPALSTSLGTSATADANGYFTELYVAAGVYDVIYKNADGALITEIEDVVVLTSNNSVEFDDVADLIADTRFTYANGGAYEGAIWRTQKEGYAYEVLAEVAAAEDLSTAGGVKLNVVGPRLHLSATGIATDGTENASTALARLDARVTATEGLTLVIDGTFLIDAPVSLKSRAIECPGKLVLGTGFTPTSDGYVVRLGEDNTTNGGRSKVELYFDGLDYCGKAAGTWDASSGSFPSGASDTESFKVTTGGTVDGVTFSAGELLVATKDAPSTTTFTGNWVQRAELAMVRIEGQALPPANHSIAATNADRVVHAINNTERLTAYVSGSFVHTIVDEERASGSPDNNDWTIIGSTFGVAYENSGSIRSQVRLNVQAQITDYGRPFVNVTADRSVTFSGLARGMFTAFTVNQANAVAHTGVQFDDLVIAYSDDATSDWLVITETRAISGRVTGYNVGGGVVISECLGSNLEIVADGQRDGVGITLGSTSNGTTAARLRLEFTNSNPAGQTSLGDLQRVIDCDLNFAGIEGDITCALSTRSCLRLPVRFLDQAATLTNTGDIAVTYYGSQGGTVSQITSKTTAVTLNKLTGQVETHDAALAAGAVAIFTVNNSFVGATDIVIASIRVPTSAYRVDVVGTQAGLFLLALENITGGSRSENVQILFEVRPTQVST